MDYEQRTLRVEWDREGRLSGVVWLSPEGQRQLVSYEYDRFGFLLGGKDAYGKAFSYSYDDAGYMTRKVNRRGHGFTYEYDTQGRCTRGRGDNGEVALLMAYFPTKQCTLVTHEESGAQWWYRYVPEGTVTEIEDPYGGIRTFRLDERGQPVAEVDAAGQVYPYVRDAAGAPLGKRDPLGYVRPLDALPHELAEALQYEGPRRRSSGSTGGWCRSGSRCRGRARCRRRCRRRRARRWRGPRWRGWCARSETHTTRWCGWTSPWRVACTGARIAMTGPET